MKKIELYRIRTFSDIFEDSIQWLKDNRRAVLRYIAPVAGVCVVILSSVFLWAYIMSEEFYEIDFWDKTLFATFTIIFISLWLLPTMFFTLYDLYRQRENGLKNLSVKTFRKALPAMTRRMLAMPVAAIAIIAFIILLFGSETVLSFFILPIGIMAMPPLFIYPAVVALSGKESAGSIKETFSLGYSDYGTIFKVSVALLFFSIALFILSFTSLGIIVLIEDYLPDSLLHGVGEEIFKYAIFFITFALLTASAYFLVLLALVVGAHTYGSIKESEEGISIDAKIENFENL